VLPTVTVIVEVPAPGTAIVCGANEIVEPDGMCEAERLIGLLKPLTTEVVIVKTA
jgi:hypothetical protein